MIQLRWSDEKDWKDHVPVKGDGREQMVKLHADFQKAKQRFGLKYDVELRVKPEAHDAVGT